MLTLIFLLIVPANAWSNISGKPEFSLEKTVESPDLKKGVVKLQVPWSVDVLDVLNKYDFDSVRPNVTDQIDLYHGIVDQCTDETTEHDRLLLFWSTLQTSTKTIQQLVNQLPVSLLKKCFTKDITYKTNKNTTEITTIKTEEYSGTFTKANLQTSMDDPDDFYKFEQMKIIGGDPGKTSTWETLNKKEDFMFNIKLIPVYTPMNYSDPMFYHNRSSPILENVYDIWREYKKLYPAFVMDAIEKIDKAQSAHDENSHDENYYDSDTDLYSIDQVSIDSKLEKSLSTNNRPELLSLFFEGLQTTGMTGMAVSRSAVGSIMSGAVGMAGYLGQAILLLTQINQIPPAPETPYQHQVFLSKTGQRHCNNPAVPLTVYAGSSLYNSNSSMLTDTLQTIVTVTTGSGIINDKIRVGCWNSMLKSLTVSSNKILKFDKTEGAIHHWHILNLDHHLRTHNILEFTCGSEPTLKFIGEPYQEVKIWRPTDTTGDSMRACTEHPLKQIGWNTLAGCSLNPVDTLQGHYTCGQLLAGSSKSDEKFILMTDIVADSMVKIFEFDQNQEFDMDFVHSKAARSYCKGGLVNGCVWPENLWKYNDKKKQRTFKVGLSADFSRFQFVCPSGTNLRVINDTEGHIEWTVSETGQVDIFVDGIFSTISMECHDPDFVTDRFTFHKVSGDEDVSTEVEVTDYRVDWFKTHYDPLYSDDKSKVSSLKVGGIYFTLKSGSWRSNSGESVCVIDDEQLECSGVATNIPLTFQFKTDAPKVISETTFLFRDMTFEKSKNSHIMIPVEIISQMKKLETLLTLGTSKFSEILNKAEFKQWPGQVYVTAQAIIDDFTQAEEAEAYFKQEVRDELVKLQKEVSHSLGSDPDMYCCYDNKTTTLEFWKDDWSCQGLHGCFEKASVMWPVDLFDVFDTIVNVKEIILKMIHVMVELNSADEIMTHDAVTLTEIETIQQILDRLDEPRMVEHSVVPYLCAILFGGFFGIAIGSLMIRIKTSDDQKRGIVITKPSS
ncbi:B22R protein [Salmon gill poxvirus]|nr:B22R protein [Salmon gill poxvirus]